MPADPSDINTKIATNIYTNNAGKITATVLAGVLFAITAWVVDRATEKGVRLDVVSDLNMTCDGTVNDSGTFRGALDTYKAAATSVTFVFSQPKKCVIDPAVVGGTIITGALNFSGINGGGLKFVAGSSLNSDALFSWTFADTTERTVRFDHMSIDANSAVPNGGFTGSIIRVTSPATGGGATLISLGTDIVNVAPPAAGSGILLMQGIGLASCLIDGGVFSLTASSKHVNQALIIGNDATQSADCRIVNTLTHHSDHIFNGKSFTYIGNQVDGNGFGGCAVFAPTFSTNPANTYERTTIISGNTCEDSATVLDDNHTALPGFDVSIDGAIFTGNKTKNTCGPGVQVLGSVTVTDNDFDEPGTCNAAWYYNAGVEVAQLNYEAPSGSGAYIAHNRTHHVSGGLGHLEYCETFTGGNSGNPYPSTLGKNECSGASLGNYFATAAVALNFESPIPGNINKLVNPCAQFTRPNGGAATGTSLDFFADQWYVQQSTGALSVVSAAPVLPVDRCTTAIQMTIVATHVPTGAQSYSVIQEIPKDETIDLWWGTPKAKDVILSGCFRSSLPPGIVVSVILYNNNANVSYGSQAPLEQGGGSTQCYQFRIPGDQDHFLGAGPTPGLWVIISVGAGPTNSIAAGAWTAGQAYEVTGAYPSSDFVSQANGSTLLSSEWRLFASNADSGVELLTPNQELSRLAPFYGSTFNTGVAPAKGAAGQQICTYGTTQVYVPFTGPGQFRVAPTVTLYNPVNAAAAAGAVWRDETTNADLNGTAGDVTTQGFNLRITSAIPAATDKICTNYTANALLQ